MRNVVAAISGFYAVLDREDEALARMLLSSGARVLQVRLKPAGRRVGADEVLRVAKMARRVCDEMNAALVVNDRLDVALLAGADGVHLGQTDLSLAEARPIAKSLWIGVSTHDVAQVRAAVAGGADYLGYGPVFATTTKENPDPTQGLDALRAAVVAAGATPVVAIGGVTPAHAVDVYATGAAAICAISAVNASADPRAAGRALAR
ncbi:MAG TPA: thiamine phosphate synthase [Kofleriaceae bacterium]